MYLAVPKAWEELARAMRADPALNRRFHERLRVRFYAAAALSQPLWDELDALAAEATDHELPMITGLGSTETAPMGTCTDGSRAGRAGDIGMPVPGITLKMVPTDGKLELRVSGPCITPGLLARSGEDGGSVRRRGLLLHGRCGSLDRSAGPGPRAAI